MQTTTLPKCVKCGSTKIQKSYQWCFPCFKKWEEKRWKWDNEKKCYIKPENKEEPKWLGSE